MGFHVCTYCSAAPGALPQKTGAYSPLSSGDVTLTFDSGRSWQMPDMILHYVADHNWQPPEVFVDDVMHHDLVAGGRAQTKSLPTSVGYLTDPFEPGAVPEGFVSRLESLMKQAADQGDRDQYRSLVWPPEAE